MLHGATITNVLGGTLRRRTLDRKSWYRRLLREQQAAQAPLARLRRTR